MTINCTQQTGFQAETDEPVSCSATGQCACGPDCNCGDACDCEPARDLISN